MEIQKIFANNLKECRKQLGMTQNELAQKIEYTEKSISKWESGSFVAPTDALLKLAKALEVTVDYLLTPKSKIKYYLGIHGGDTEITFRLCDDQGITIREETISSYDSMEKTDDVSAIVENLKMTIKHVCKDIPFSEISLFAGMAGVTENKLDIFNRHLKRVLEISKKYDFESIIWADMYFSAENDHYYGVPDAVIPQDAIDNAPSNVELCFWHYYDTDYSYYHKKFVQYERFKNPVSFGGGVWTWDGFVPYFKFTLDTMLPALKACVDHNVKNVYATMWGNGGCETDYFKAFDGLAVFSEYCYKGTECTIDDIYDAASCITNSDRRFIDTLSSLFLGYDGAAGIGKGLFYTDPLINLLHFDIDYNVIKDTYEKALVNLENYKYHEDYRYYKYFIRIALQKAEIIFNLQREYKSGNTKYMLYIANELIPELKNDYNEFYNEFYTLWHKRYKVFGFEAIDNRFGGICNRLTYTSNVLNKYCNNEFDSIDELEPEIIKGLKLTWRYAPSYMNSYLPY